MKTIIAIEQQYFYHPDHLGSSSFITDASGDAHQHSLCRSMFCPLVQGFTRSRNVNKTRIGMQYLPYGEDFISQRIDWQTRYTFSAKEKDKNTGYHYFGARYYDSEVSVWLNVDPKAHLMPGWSSYAAFRNNPLMYVDPDGQFPVVSGLVGFAKGLFSKKENFEQKGTTRMGNALRSAWRHEKNSWKMTAGLFTADKDKSFGGKVLQIASRFTWELPQTVGGLLSSYGANLFGQVENVDFESGATVSQMRGYFGAFTMGSYIVGDRTIAADPNNSLFQHEYGHYLQSQRSGYTYLFKYAIPSLVSAASNSYWGHNAHWTEQDANIRAKAYWEKTIPGYSGWSHRNNPIQTGSKIVNPKWWEFVPPLFPVGVTLLNLNKGR